MNNDASIEMNWHENFFPGVYGKILSALDDSQAADQARLIKQLLALRKGQSVLDCPCGYGRITRGLSNLGLKVTGVDFVETYLRSARRQTRKAGLEAVYQQADMRALTFEGMFDAVVCWFTSFGYFSDRDNRRQLQGFYRALKPGGKLLIETQNKSMILKHFLPRIEHVSGGVRVLVENRYDSDTSRIHSTWTMDDGSLKESHDIAIRLFNGKDIRRELSAMGFDQITLHPHDPQKRFTRHSKRLIAVARRP